MGSYAELITGCTVIPYVSTLVIRSIKHKGLKAFVEKNDLRGLPPEKVTRIRNILSVLVLAQNMNDVNGPPGWRIHTLRGDRAGQWSVTVSGNWRITFDVINQEIWDLNLEDYH